MLLDGVQAAPEVRAAPDKSFLSGAKEGKLSSGGGGLPLAAGLKKRLSFGRGTKKDQAPREPPSATTSEVQLRPGRALQPGKKSPGGTNRSPKGGVEGEMDDDELERYLRDLELNHVRERTEFENAGSPT